MLAKALDLAAAGFPVFPCSATTKAPRIAGGFRAASTDPAAIRAMDWSGNLIGVPTGPRDQGGCGLDVLDIDAAAGGDVWWADNAARIPATLIQETRRAGGKHVWFVSRPGTPCSAGRIAPGVDVRAAGGYVVHWQSAGRPVWLEFEPAPWPAWLAEQAGRRPVAADPATAERLTPPSAAAVVELLNRMHNGADVTRDAYVSVMHAAAGCARLVGDDDGAIQDAAVSWAARYSGDYEAEESKWLDDWSHRPAATAWPQLQGHAVRLIPGYQAELAAAEFDALPLPPAAPAKAGHRRLIGPDDLAEMAGRAYRVKGLLAERDVGCLFGPPGAGKSLLAPFLAYRIAQGEPFFGLRTKQGPVIYVAAEDESGMASRMRALRGRHGTAPFLLTQGVSDLNVGSPDLAWLLSEVESRRPALVVIDTLAMAWPGTIENEADSMGRVVAVARRLTEWGAAVLLVHHSNKAQDGTPRGHSLLNGALDMAIALEPRDSEGVIRGRLTKNRNGACDHALAFRIGVATLGVDDDGDPITAAMCEPLAAGEGVRAPGMGDKQAAALARLRAMLAATEHATAEGQPGVPAEAWKAECMALSDGTDPKSRAKAARRWRLDLIGKGLIRLSGDLVTLAAGDIGGQRPVPTQPVEITGRGTRGQAGDIAEATGKGVGTRETLAVGHVPCPPTVGVDGKATVPPAEPVKGKRRPSADDLAAMLAAAPAEGSA